VSLISTHIHTHTHTVLAVPAVGVVVVLIVAAVVEVSTWRQSVLSIPTFSTSTWTVSLLGLTLEVVIAAAAVEVVDKVAVAKG